MFDLEEAIAGWRREMVAGGVIASEVLEELESHLRDDIEQELRNGIETRRAFDGAAGRIGQAHCLKSEFSKATGWQDLILTLAGIPNSNLVMNTTHTNIEPAWATYLKTAGYLAPAIFLWGLAAIFIVPKLQQICLHAGLPASGTFFWDLTEASIRTTISFGRYWLFGTLGLIAVLALLERRFSAWPRYRRASVGVGAFLLNTLILLSIFIMFVAALVAAPALMKGAH
jgi:hypothetical protein